MKKIFFHTRLEKRLPAVNRCLSQRGIALLTVLWVLTILMVIVLSFSLIARTETYATLSFKEGIERKFMAEAGIERGIMELYYRNLYKNQTVELEGREIWKTDGTPYSSQIGNGVYLVRIRDESGKIDINAANDLVLKNLFVNLGVQPDDADVIVDSIMDWRDPDDLHRLNGAENDYYRSLPNPYDAKNAKFDTLEELLLVKGITHAILYGSGEQKGAVDFLTIHAKTSRINVNAATKEALMAIPGMTPEVADAIISFRETKEMNSQDFMGIVGENYNFMLPYITTSGTSTFTIDASGHTANAEGGYAIRATIMISSIDQYTYLYYKSPVTFKP